MVRFDFHKRRFNNVAEFVLPRLSAISASRGLALACLILRLGVVYDIGGSPMRGGLINRAYTENFTSREVNLSVPGHSFGTGSLTGR